MLFLPSDYETNFKHFSGLDVDWFATDRLGRVAHFTSAGSGPIPDAVVRMKDNLRELEDYLKNLPPTKCKDVYLSEVLSEGQVALGMKQQRTKYIQELIISGKRGIFSYDADLKREEGYIQVARPSIPLLVSDLEIFYKGVLENIILDCDFAREEGLY